MLREPGSITKAHILLLDHSPASDLGSTLREILRSAFSSVIQLRQKSIGANGQVLCDDDPSSSSANIKPDVVFLVLRPGMAEKAGALLSFLDGESADAPIIVAIESGSPEELFGLLELGAADFITPPLKTVDIFPRVWRLVARARQGSALMQALKVKMGLKRLIGVSPVFLSEIRKIPLLAQCDASVLISGETGTGKELFAQAIHYLSPRTDKPFVPVNCGAIPVELAENELFGHERGAFTSASAPQLGLIHEADGGTLFLDEIDCLPLLVQIKLLRFLQEKEYRPLGSAKRCTADVRIITASNIDLEEAVRAGRVRQDLYYRLNVIPLVLPPLRERREDIPLLARHFLATYSKEFKKRVMNFSVQCMQSLLLYEWPGNVRELQHAVERAVALSEHEVIGLADVSLPRTEASPLLQPFRDAKAKVIAEFEKTYIQHLLVAHQGNITKAAQASHKNRRAFWQLMRKHRIQPESFRSRVY